MSIYNTYTAKKRQILICHVLVVLIILFTLFSCSSSKQIIYYKGMNMNELVKAGNILGFDIAEKDNWQLMLEAASWIGTPYKFGGSTKGLGTDCSGLNAAIYNNVYGKQLHRKSVEQFTLDCKAVKQSKLRQGDLLFFSTTENKSINDINHTGLYLRDGLFIHASSSRGVVIDNLNSAYFQRCWVTGGRVK
ncbi:MAG: C40 family peptidase [Bacteroidaceae bacterium]|nr:C40 family peptidase [Bacteroidaceae bacterium]